MRKHLHKLLVLLLVLTLAGLVGCSKKEPSLDFGLKWDETKGVIGERVGEIPSKQVVFTYYDNRQALGTPNLLLKINSAQGVNISGISVSVKPEERGVLIPVQIDEPGGYKMQIVAGEKVLFEKDVVVK